MMDAYGLLSELQDKIVEKCSDREEILRAISKVEQETLNLRMNSLPESALLSLKSQDAAAKYELQLLREHISSVDGDLEKENQVADETEEYLKKAEEDLDSLAGLIHRELTSFEAVLNQLLEQDTPHEQFLMGKEDLEGQRWCLQYGENTREDVLLEREISRLRIELQKAQHECNALKASAPPPSRQAKAPSSTPVVSPKSVPPLVVADKFKTASELRWGSSPSSSSSSSAASSDPYRAQSPFVNMPSTATPLCFCHPPQLAVTKVGGGREGAAQYWVCANTNRKGKGVHHCGFMQAKPRAQVIEQAQAQAQAQGGPRKRGGGDGGDTPAWVQSQLKRSQVPRWR